MRMRAVGMRGSSWMIERFQSSTGEMASQESPGRLTNFLYAEGEKGRLFVGSYLQGALRC